MNNLLQAGSFFAPQPWKRRQSRRRLQEAGAWLDRGSYCQGEELAFFALMRPPSGEWTAWVARFGSDEKVVDIPIESLGWSISGRARLPADLAPGLYTLALGQARRYIHQPVRFKVTARIEGADPPPADGLVDLEWPAHHGDPTHPDHWFSQPDESGARVGICLRRIACLTEDECEFDMVVVDAQGRPVSAPSRCRSTGAPEVMWGGQKLTFPRFRPRSSGLEPSEERPDPYVPQSLWLCPGPDGVEVYGPDQPGSGWLSWGFDQGLEFDYTGPGCAVALPEPVGNDPWTYLEVVVWSGDHFCHGMLALPRWSERQKMSLQLEVEAERVTVRVDRPVVDVWIAVVKSDARPGQGGMAEFLWPALQPGPLVRGLETLLPPSGYSPVHLEATLKWWASVCVNMLGAGSPLPTYPPVWREADPLVYHHHAQTVDGVLMFEVSCPDGCQILVMAVGEGDRFAESTWVVFG